MKYLSKAVKIELFEQGLKTCTKCKETLPLDEFHNHSGRQDGKTDWCNSCARVYKGLPSTLAAQRKRKASPEGQEWQRQYWQTDAYKESQRRYRQSEKGKAVAIRHTERRKELFPEKVSAVCAVHNAVKAGKLPKAQACICEHCGDTAEQYHHESYLPEHWLDVIPLCMPCHKSIHYNPKE